MPSLATNNTKRSKRLGTYEYIMSPLWTRLQDTQYYYHVHRQHVRFFIFNLVLLLILQILTTAADDVLWYIYFHSLKMYDKYELYYLEDYAYYILGLTVTYSFIIVFHSDLFYDIMHVYVSNQEHQTLCNPKFWLILSTSIIFHCLIAGSGLYVVVNAYMTQSSGFVYRQMFSLWCQSWFLCELFQFGYVYILFIIPFITPLLNLMTLYIFIKYTNCLMVTQLSNYGSDFDYNYNYDYTTPTNNNNVGTSISRRNRSNAHIPRPIMIPVEPVTFTPSKNSMANSPNNVTNNKRYV